MTRDRRGGPARRRGGDVAGAASVAVTVALVVTITGLTAAPGAAGATARRGARHAGTTTGALEGDVVMTAGRTSATPTHRVTVELVAGSRRVVARHRTKRHGTFDFVVGPGTYRIEVAGVHGCKGRATVRGGGRPTSVTVICPLVPALGSDAFATLPMSGAVTTRVDAMKRLVHGTTGTTRLAATRTTWRTFLAVSTTGATAPTGTTGGPPPTGLSMTSTVWVACASGGTYTTFDGTSGYSSKCTAYAARTGSPLATQDSHGWPSWFTRLPAPATGWYGAPQSSSAP